MVTSVYVPFRPVSPIKTFKFATFVCSHALLPWKLNRYSCRELFGINCTALDQSELSNFVECIISYKIPKIYKTRPSIKPGTRNIPEHKKKILIIMKWQC